jgi:NAD(P)-dependent dehydrogenase (short-subunit alcohol dehydrogenase family)
VLQCRLHFKESDVSQTFIVTGANRGLGLELVRQLKEAGNDVIATARKPADATELNDLGVRVEALDIGEGSSIASFVERMGGRPVDVLINNAGVGVGGRSFESLDWEQVELFFRVNAVGTTRLTQALLPNLREGQGKRVLNITSKMGSIGDNTSGGAYAYRTSKAALNALTKSLSLDLAAEGFLCAVLHPGWVATDMGGSAAPLGCEESVRGMLEVGLSLGADQNGSFHDYSGAVIPW